MIYKAPPEKHVKKTDLSPASYDRGTSFIKSQLPKPRFYIDKGKYENFMNKTLKNKKWVPGSGSYDPDKATRYLTKGAARGWK